MNYRQGINEDIFLLMSRFADSTYIRFVIVGVFNTLVGTGIMLFCYNVLHISYWWSSVANYFLVSTLSYLLNKSFTFHYGNADRQSMLRFVLNILVCYILAYGIAKTLIRWILAGTIREVQENVAMVVGTLLFVVFNYLGQRFYAFKKNENTIYR